MKPRVAIRGWCPGALRPMESGDGLIVRIRPFAGALTLEQAAALAEMAQALGNGHIDLTRRANLQLRGLSDERLPELHADLHRVSLLDADPELEASRNIMVSPLAGVDSAQELDVRPIAVALHRALAGDGGVRGLPAKFGLLVDGGGALSIAGERADLSLAAGAGCLALGLDTAQGTDWLGAVEPDRAVDVTMTVLRLYRAAGGDGRMRDRVSRLRASLLPLLRPLAARPAPGSRRLGLMGSATGIAAPFGRLEAAQLRQLTVLARRAGARDMRLSPWRSVYFDVADRTLLQGAQALGLIVDEGDPLLRLEACPGAPECRSSSVDTRRDARRLAALAAEQGYHGTIHVSGCAKKCAAPAACDLTLTGEEGAYRSGSCILQPADFARLLQAAAHG